MSRTILLVDDDRNLLHALVRNLRNQDYAIFTAGSGEEAKRILKTRKVDLVVTDEQMPGMSGTDLLSWIAAELPAVVRIVLTGQPSMPSALRAINEGDVHRYLTKPCDVVRLAIVIGRALDELEQGRDAQQSATAPSA